jgi:hypothetical protein
MSKLANQWLLAVSIILLALSAAVGVSAQTVKAPPDSTLFTTYSLDVAHTSVSWLVCGSTQQTSGCYASGNLGPFGKVGALLEGNQWSITNTVTRSIYVLDIATGSNQNGVTLYVYKKIDIITPSFDTVSITLSNTVSLPLLIGGSSALSYMAANKNYLFIGTDQGPSGAEVKKGTLTITPIGVNPPITAITADRYGYVTVTYGSFPQGFVLFGPNGLLQESGGGGLFLLNTVQAVLASTLP